jgi:hypothetical protein
MKQARRFLHRVAALSILASAAVTARAQQVTGTPGSPSATTTINGLQLPPPPFAGKIERNAAPSTPYWPMRVEPRQGAPNILLIMTDDSGFGVPSTFGGVIPTPALDRIAALGLRYTNFNSTALCSPTRAALITGRNHHSVGFGVIAEQSTGFPGYNSIIPRDKATIGRILKDNGYRTSWFGKDHNTPAFEASQAGIATAYMPNGSMYAPPGKLNDAQLAIFPLSCRPQVGTNPQKGRDSLAAGEPCSAAARRRLEVRRTRRFLVGDAGLRW